MARMQLICGQCGKHLVVTPRPGVEWARCDACAHEVYIAHMVDSSAPAAEPSFSDSHEDFAELARKALRERLLVVCGSCGGRMRVTRRMAGQVVRCLTCSKEIRIPVLDDGELLSDAYMPTPMTEVAAELADISHGERFASRRRQELLRKQRQKRTMLVTAAVVLTVLVLILGMAWSTISARRGKPQPIAKPEPAPTPTPIASRPAPTPGPGPARMALGRLGYTIEGGAWEWFADRSYFVARPGHLYCRLRLVLKAGRDAVTLPNWGSAIRLRIGEKEYESLGEPGDESAAPRLARQRTVRLGPGRSATMDVLFEVPDQSASAELLVEGAGARPVNLTPPPKPSAKWLGEFEEHPPRNLRPMLRDPVMSAIQQAVGDRLLVQKNTDGFRIRLPKAGVTGQGAVTDDGDVQLTLRRGGHELAASLRALPPGGDVLVLYLRDEPMNQLVYRRKGSRAAPPAASKPAPRKDPAGPASPPKPRPPVNTDNGQDSRPTFFGVSGP